MAGTPQSDYWGHPNSQGSQEITNPAAPSCCQRPQMDKCRGYWGRPVPGLRVDVHWESLGGGLVSANGAPSLPLGSASGVSVSRWSIEGSLAGLA